jgi:hypothetical protein
MTSFKRFIPAAMTVALAGLVSQPSLGQSFPAGNVRVQGNQRIEAETVTSYLTFQPGQTIIEPWTFGLNSAQLRANQGYVEQFLDLEEARRQAVINIVIIIGNIIGEGCDLRFRRGPSSKAQVIIGIELSDGAP